jgi:hypothetical protein
MTLSAWVFMLCAWTVIIGSVSYCFWKLLTSDRQLDGPDPDSLRESIQSKEDRLRSAD